MTDNPIDDIKVDFSPDTYDTDTEENENENNYKEDEHIEQNSGISCESADKDIQEDQCAEEYVNHEGRQGSKIKFVEQTVTQRSNKRKSSILTGILRLQTKKIKCKMAADISDLMPSVKQITSDLKQLHETLNISERRGIKLCMTLEEYFETILNAIRVSYIPYRLPEEDTLGTSLKPFDFGEHSKAL